MNDIPELTLGSPVTYPDGYIGYVSNIILSGRFTNNRDFYVSVDVMRVGEVNTIFPLSRIHQKNGEFYIK